MNVGRYTRYSVVTLCGLLLFFLGSSLPFQTELIALVSLFAVILLTVALSYGNRTPLGGFVLGLFTSTSFLLGFFFMTCIWELSTTQLIVIGPVGRDFGLFLLSDVLSLYGPGMLSAVLAFASIGLFFGLLGYVSEHTSLQVSVTKPYLFRDYWSSIHNLGKSDRRAYHSLDRKLSSWSLRKKLWLRRLVEKLTEPQSDLIFVSHTTKKPSSVSTKGDLYDFSSGRMIGNDLLDPADLTSKYRPLILKVPEGSSTPKGIRRLSIEELLTRFLDWFIPSHAIWIVYLVLSGILILSVHHVWAGFPVYAIEIDPIEQPILEQMDYPAVASAVIASAVTLFFVWRWRRASKELFKRRPDERVLIFIVYIIFALLYGFYFEVIVHPPAVPEGWVESWLIWPTWLVPLTVLLGFGYIFIHRECEVVNTYFYDNHSHPSPSQVSPFKEAQDKPFWLNNEKVRGYWVLRFMYFWRYEIATIPHSDWERVEVWVDAEKGTVEWIITDYHYRELWYKVEEHLPALYIKFFINFHTPIPVVNPAEAMSIAYIFTQRTRELINLVATGKALEILNLIQASLDTSQKWRELHPSDWIRRFGLPSAAAGFCSKLPWTYWRYPKGLEKPDHYQEEAASKPEEQPSLLIKG